MRTLKTMEAYGLNITNSVQLAHTLLHLFTITFDPLLFL